MKIRCLMMFKNEDDLLMPWALYHGALFGAENLRLYDNGSTSPRTLAQIAKLQMRGVSIDRSHSRNADFVGKGNLFAEAIRWMDERDGADFYLPLDCDEFVAVETAHGLSCRSDDIRSALTDHVGHGGVLAIQVAYQNLPGSVDRFRPAFGALGKTFFARGACRTLDCGFHHGTGRTPGPPVATPLVHIHYHNKPLALLKQHARQKLEARDADMSDAGLADLRRVRGAGWHLLDYFDLRDSKEYHASFEGGFSLTLPDFVRAMQETAGGLPFADAF